MDILKLSVTVFIVQLVFIGFRTLNIRAVAEKNIVKVLYTGAIIHLSWLVGIAIGATTMHEIMMDFRWEYLPIIICSLAGGLIGSYMGLVNKIKK